MLQVSYVNCYISTISMLYAFKYIHFIEGNSDFSPKIYKRRNLFLEELYLCFFQIFFFYVGFLSQTFTIDRTVGEGGGYFFDSSLSLFIRWEITSESSPLHIVSSWTQKGGFRVQAANQ